MGIKYAQLSLPERRAISDMLDAKMPITTIARQLGRHHSTIYREKVRNKFRDPDDARETYFDGYFHTIAHKMAFDRRTRLSKLHRSESLRNQVLAKLKVLWSPEQIAGRMKQERQADYVCPETIYKFIYSDHGRTHHLYQYLEKARKKRRRRYARKPRGFSVPDANIIHKRPVEINDRSTFGHWECDLVAFNREFGKHNVTSLVERKSRYLFVMKNPSRHSEGVFNRIIDKLSTLPVQLRKSVTFDRGTEFAFFRQLKEQLDMESYFCDPQAPYQKGAVENANLRLRRYLPRSTDIAKISDDNIKRICDRLNNTPRKCLEFRSPAEVMSLATSRNIRAVAIRK